jgi:hypothetical protein
VGWVGEARGEVAAAWAKGSRLSVAAALEEMGVQTVRHGHAPHRVPLLAAAAALCQAMGPPVRPADRTAIDGALAAARTTLGGRYLH